MVQKFFDYGNLLVVGKIFQTVDVIIVKSTSSLLSETYRWDLIFCSFVDVVDADVRMRLRPFNE